MYGTRIFVPFSLCTKILDALHDAHQGIHDTHQGIVKFRERARSSVRWPKIGIDMHGYVMLYMRKLLYATY